MPTPTSHTPRVLCRGRAAPALVLLLGAVLGMLLGTAPQASAHAALKETAPAEDSVLKTAPRHVTLTFSEGIGISANSVRVFDPGNHRVDRGEPRHTGKGDRTVRVALKGDLPQGTFTVAWRGVSADSHPVAGAFIFSVGKTSGTSVTLPQETAGGGPTGVAYDTVRYIAYGGFVVLVGGSTFVLLCLSGAAARRLRRLLLGGWAALVLSAFAQLLLRGPYESGGGLGEAFDLSSLGDTLDTKPGAALIVRLLLLVAGGAFLLLLGRLSAADHTFGRWSRTGLTGAGVSVATALAGTWAATEHASVGIQVPLAVAADLLHLLAAAVWLGGLAALTLALLPAGSGQTGADLPASAVDRFSRMAFASVTVLAVTGVYQSWRQVGSFEALSGTSYGRLLLIKLATVVLLLAVAHRSRGWTARLRGVPQPTPRVRRPVRQAVGVAAGARTGGEPGASAEAADAVTAEEAPDTEPGQVEQGATGGEHRKGGTGEEDRAADHGKGTGGGPGNRGPSKAARAAGAEARRRLRRSVAAEAAIGVVVLAVTTVLTSTQPSRAATEQAQSAESAPAPALSVVNATVPFDTGGRNGKGKVRVTLDPGQAGDNAIQAAVFDPADGFVSVPEVRISFTLKERRLGPLDAGLRDIGGYWAADSLQLPFPGRWTMSVTVRTSDIDQVTEKVPVTIGKGAGTGRS